jgi:hypothetical protein
MCRSGCEILPTNVWMRVGGGKYQEGISRMHAGYRACSRQGNLHWRLERSPRPDAPDPLEQFSGARHHVADMTSREIAVIGDASIARNRDLPIGDALAAERGSLAKEPRNSAARRSRLRLITRSARCDTPLRRCTASSALQGMQARREPARRLH